MPHSPARNTPAASKRSAASSDVVRGLESCLRGQGCETIRVLPVLCRYRYGTDRHGEDSELPFRVRGTFRWVGKYWLGGQGRVSRANCLPTRNVSLPG